MADFQRLDRRGFLKLGGAGLAGLGLAGTGLVAPRASFAQAAEAKGTPTRVIFMVSDGMSMGVVSLAEQLARRARGKGTAWAELLQDPNVPRGFFETHSLTGLVTDSAAGGVAWSTGSRCLNGVLNFLPDGTKLSTIAEVLGEKGVRIGLVTTTRVTHATPASFAAHEQSRENEDAIAPQYLDRVDVILGGGRGNFDPGRRKDKADVVAKYKEAGYTFAANKSEMAGFAGKKKLLGLFSGSHVPFTIDHMHDEKLQDEVPTLAEMTQAALDALDDSPNGFLMQVEGGRVDHAAHGNDATGLIWDQVAFDDAIRVALAYQEKRPDTLIVLTTDHGNANPGLFGISGGGGESYGGSNAAFEKLLEARGSYGRAQGTLDDIRKASGTVSAKDVADVVQELAAVSLFENEAEALAKLANREIVPNWNRSLGGFSGLFGQIMANYCGIAFLSSTHTEDYALVTAIGPGQEHFDKLQPNTAAYDIITKFFGATHKNPSMTFEEAQKYADASPARGEGDAHWA
ncbi:MAG: alkaline phosphatase [Candidatus Sumerlaeia bacterium]|nr:alkaline phosphatase [Candidatus Sumerlaeia bacterium]